MSYLGQKCKKKKKNGVANFISEITHVANYGAFEKLAHVHVIQHGLRGL